MATTKNTLATTQQPAKNTQNIIAATLKYYGNHIEHPNNHIVMC